MISTNRTRLLAAALVGGALLATPTLLADASSVGAQSSCPAPDSTGPENTGQAGDIFMYKNDPVDDVKAFPSDAEDDYTAVCWVNQFFEDLDNDLTVVANNWSIDVGIYQNLFYNNGNPGGTACLQVNDNRNLKFFDWSTGGGTNDSVSSHRGFSGGC